MYIILGVSDTTADTFKVAAQRTKAKRIYDAHVAYRPGLTREERALDLTLLDDAGWSMLVALADVKATSEPGRCQVSRTVKRYVYEAAQVGAAIRYRQRHEDVFGS